MGQKLLFASTVGGPAGLSAWHDEGDQWHFGALSLSTTALVFDVQVAPPISPVVLNGGQLDAYPDTVLSDNAYQAFYGAVIVTNTTFAANAAAEIGLDVYRAGARIGGTYAFGWKSTVNGGSGTPAFTAHVPVSLPKITANTVLVSNSLGAAVQLRQNDVVVATFVLDSSTATLQPGIIALQVN